MKDKIVREKLNKRTEDFLEIVRALNGRMDVLSERLSILTNTVADMNGN